MRTISIVGSSGFIGGYLSSRYRNSLKFNRSNMSELAYSNSDLTVIAAAPAAKWIANREPADDLNNIRNLVDSVKCIGDKNCILISTIDVFPVEEAFNEHWKIPSDHPEAYGANRGFLELELTKYLENLHIIRLPGMFGPGLKKNLIFDLMNGRPAPQISSASSFQFYDVRLLPAHLELCLESNLKIANLATEPVNVAEIYRSCFNLQAPHFEFAPLHYRMETIFGEELAGRKGPYLLSKGEVLETMKQWTMSDSK